MKRKMIRSLLAVALVSSTAGPVLGAPLEHGAGGLALTLQCSKPSYALGELVSLNIKVSNQTGQTVFLSTATDVWTGAVRVFIASEGGDFKEYLGPGWGLKDIVRAAQLEIPPRGSFETAATVLYNHSQETGHLSELYAREIRGKRVADHGRALQHEPRILGHGRHFPGDRSHDGVRNDALGANRAPIAPL